MSGPARAETDPPRRAAPASPVGRLVRRWWRRLNGQDEHHADRGALADLRRCRDPIDVVVVPAFHRLRRQVRDAGHTVNDDRLAVAAAVLAHVREDNHRTPVAPAFGSHRTVVGARDADDNAVMSYGRFRRLLQAERPDEVLREMRRAVALLDRRVNLADLGEAIVYWGDTIRRRWAFLYYDAEAPTGLAEPTDQDDEDRQP